MDALRCSGRDMEDAGTRHPDAGFLAGLRLGTAVQVALFDWVWLDLGCHGTLSLGPGVSGGGGGTASVLGVL